MRHSNIRLIVFSALVLAFNTAPTAALAATSAMCPGEQGYIYTNYRATRNPRAGGFVSDSAYVGDYVFIAKTAAVCGSASVLEKARVYGNAVVAGESEVTDEARVYGNSRVDGTAYVGGKAKVSDHAHVSGEAIVEGVAWIRGYAKISSGHYSEGTKKPARSQKSIDDEKREAALKKAAEEKRAQCRSNWYAKEKSLEEDHDYWKSVCYSQNGGRCPSGEWGYLRFDNSRDELNEHRRNSVSAVCG